MVCSSSQPNPFATKLLSLSREQATGKLVVFDGKDRWQVYLFCGHLLYITGDRHRVRRWTRSIAQNCPNFEYDAKEVAGVNLWEYQLLYTGISRVQIGLTQAKAALTTIIGELFFTIFSAGEVKLTWLPTRRQPGTQNPSSGLPLSPQEIEQVCGQSLQLCEQWQEMGLSYLCPDRAPVWKKTPAWRKRLTQDSTASLSRLFNGQNTFWDIALTKKRSVLDVTRTLHHFVQQGEIGLRSVMDLPSPFEQLDLVNAAVTRNRPLIACIDDSLTVTQHLRQILLPAGYQVLTIQNPLEEMALLVKQKPALILLDLVMPQLNGTDFCSFLRKTTVFRDTPIVILTSNDGVVDRVRAGINGASDFLSKPPKPEKVLQTIRKYLDEERPSQAPISTTTMAQSMATP
ncbi:MAG: response regulator [Cyanobacteriota bacterium]|nr:response regulator [Cyanobacteriota bacterium]